MTITRDMIARDCAEKSGYYLKDVKNLLSVLDEVVKDYLCTVDDDDDEILVQIVSGVKLKAKVVPERKRVDPRTQEPIICAPVVKLQCKFSDIFKNAIQQAYENNKK